MSGGRGPRPPSAHGPAAAGVGGVAAIRAGLYPAPAGDREGLGHLAAGGGEPGAGPAREEGGAGRGCRGHLPQGCHFLTGFSGSRQAGPCPLSPAGSGGRPWSRGSGLVSPPGTAAVRTGRAPRALGSGTRRGAPQEALPGQPRLPLTPGRGARRRGRARFPVCGEQTGPRPRVRPPGPSRGSFPVPGQGRGRGGA